MPNFVPCFATAGVEALRMAAGQLRDFQLRAPIDTSLATAEDLAADYLAKLNYHEHLFALLPPDAQDRVAVAAGMPVFADFVPEEPEEDPEERAYLWEREAAKVLFVRQPPPPPGPRTVSATPAHETDWPELATLEAFSAAGPSALAAALARALGPDFSPLPPAGSLGLACIHSHRWDLSFAAIPGGVYRMGMTEEEEADLSAQLLAVAPDSAGYAARAAATGRPTRMVRVRPFLCARSPWLEKHGAILGVQGDPGNPHQVLRMEMDPVFEALRATGLRLLSEAEWEWIARAGGTRTWLSEGQTPAAWAESTSDTPLEEAVDPFGMQGLGWNEWIDDGWHRNLEGAPDASDSWEPRTDLQVNRGGALALWPWQGGGELMLCHAAVRQRAELADIHAVRVALDLPKRS